MALAAVGASLPTGGRIARRSGPKSARRWYVIIGMFASGLSLSVVGLMGWRAGLSGAGIAFAAGLGGSAWVSRRAEAWRGPARILVGAVTLATVFAFVGAARSSAGAADQMGAPCVRDGVYFPSGLGAFGAQERSVEVFPLPTIEGALVDQIALRTGHSVQLLVLPASTSRGTLLRTHPGKNPEVFGSLMPDFDERFSVKRGRRRDAASSPVSEGADGDAEASVWEIYRGGEVIAEAWFVRDGPSAPVVALFGAPYGGLSGVDGERYLAVARAESAPADADTAACLAGNEASTPP